MNLMLKIQNKIITNFILLFMTFSILFQEVENFDKFYTISGVYPTDFLLPLLFSISFLNFYHYTLFEKLFLITNISLIFFGVIVGAINGNDYLNILKDISHWIKPCVFPLLFLFRNSFTNTHLKALNIILISYLAAFICVYIIDSSLVVEYSLRVVSRFDIVLLFVMLFTLTHSDNSRGVSLLSLVLILIKIIISFSRGLFAMFFIVVLLAIFNERRTRSIYYFILALCLLILSIYFLMADSPYIDFFHSRFGELWSDGDFSLSNTSSWQYKSNDLNNALSHSGFLGNGLGSVITVFNAIDGDVPSLYVDNFFYTAYMKFGLLSIPYFLYIFYYFFNRINNSAFIILVIACLSNASIIYWRSSIFIYFLLIFFNKNSNRNY